MNIRIFFIAEKSIVAKNIKLQTFYNLEKEIKIAHNEDNENSVLNICFLQAVRNTRICFYSSLYNRL